MEFKYHALALVGSILLGLIAAFVTKNILVGLGLPIGLYICAMLWGKVKALQEEEKELNPQEEQSSEIPKDQQEK
jgi:uncharacterized membrane protein YciS (DUF1049 family)